ncbi:MAG: hypothetical protein JST09_01450 [Bacteroidetes bacterium]|nr:hypothetical protein [Bacteroidota bacterium]
MGIKIGSIFLFLSSLILSSGCKNGVCISPTQHYLKGGYVNYTSIVDSIRVGDTIFVNSIIPKFLKGLYDQSLNDSIDFSDATNMITDFHVIVLLGLNSYSGAIDSFEFLPVEGNLKANNLAPDKATTIAYDEKNGVYYCSFGMIAKRKGIYSVNLIDIYQARKQCSVASIKIGRNNVEGNLHYLKDIYYGGATINSIDSSSYCFKVY